MASPAPDEAAREWWTLEEVAVHYRRSPDTIRYWRQKQYGPKGERVGQRVLYPASEIARFDSEIHQSIEARKQV
jgi:hypothetical protein